MNFESLLGAELYPKAKAYAKETFGDRKIATLIRLAVAEYLERWANNEQI